MTHLLGTNPLLYERRGTARSPEPPALRGGRCTCGYVFFPMQSFGCEVCGAYGESLRAVALEGRGKLVAAVTVHLHAAKDREAPFRVGTIALDDGPTVRAILTDDGPLPVPGTMMVSTFVEMGADESGAEIVELRFTPERSH